MARVLHITAHLGGGVGRVLSSLVRESRRAGGEFSHDVICLEALRNPQFADQLKAAGGILSVCPQRSDMLAQIHRADIIQLEWWHHPVMARWMCTEALPMARLIIWSHISGLSPPVIPPAFLLTPHRFLFSSPCSWEHPALSGLKNLAGERVDAVFSSGGFDDLPMPPEHDHDQPLRVGYLGTLNYAKLHPRFLDYLAEVRLPDFRLALVGDLAGAHELVAQAQDAGLADRLDLRGYRTDVAAQLGSLDVFAYLLNPLHYGTTENALIEAMAMGVVPVVLDNPAERHLVLHGETGLVVDAPAAFARALDWLAANPGERRRLSDNASHFARERFSVRHTAGRLLDHYRAVLAEDKRSFDFRAIFGTDPADWFRACQGDEVWRFPDTPTANQDRPEGPHFLYEATKGSVFHYRDVFPDNPRLKRWAQQLADSRFSRLSIQSPK